MTKKNKLLDTAKDTMKLGVGSMAGYGVLGSLGAIPGMPAAAGNVTNIAGAGLQLANVGQLAKTGLVVVDSMSGEKKKSKVTDPKLRKMLGY